MEENILNMLPMEELLLQVILVVGVVFKVVLMEGKVVKEEVLMEGTQQYQLQVNSELSPLQQILEVVVTEHITQIAEQDQEVMEVQELSL